MSNLFTVDFENNKLYDPLAKGFDFIACSGGTMEVTAASHYEGTYGCEITPLQSYRLGGAKRVASLTRFRQAFYLHPHAVSIPTTRYIKIARNYHSDESNTIYGLFLKNISGTYYIWGAVDSNTTAPEYESADYELDNQDDWNLIETDWYADDVAGFFKIWINGTAKWNRSVVNGNLRLMYPCLGAMYQAYAISGSFYVDYWRANDDGSLIGA